MKKYKSKKIICSIHHIEEDKFKKNEYKNFKYLEQFIDAYHVISLNTQKQLLKYTDKRIISIPLWANQNTWFSIQDKYNLRKKYKIDINSFVVGSFQRDTEGSDLISPKLIKGPDRFVEIAKTIRNSQKDLLIILAGKRREYVISQLEELNINYRDKANLIIQQINKMKEKTYNYNSKKIPIAFAKNSLLDISSNDCETQNAVTNPHNIPTKTALKHVILL